jgi:Clp amino terminal domain, pathogenicity island component
MDRFDKFTDGARKVLTLAQDEAERFRHHYIGTEHIFLGLLRVDDGVACRVLKDMGVELDKARTAVEFIIARGDRPIVGEVGLTPRAKRVIELAIDEARGLEHNYIGTEHLLLGLVREGEGIAAGVLESLGVELDKARHEVIRALTTASSVGRTGTTFRVLDPVPGPLPVEEARSAYELSIAYSDVATGPLRHVVGIGMAAADAGVVLELIALEIRDAGSILYWKARADPERPLGQPRLTVRDTAGADYVARPAGASSTEREAKGEILITPAPPQAAVLIVEVTAFEERRFPWQAAERPGSWQFQITIP